MQLGEAAQHFVKLFAFNQTWEMEHNAGAHAGARIGWAGCEITEMIVKSVLDVTFELLVDCLGIGKCFSKAEAAAHGLNAEVIFLIH